MEGLDWTPYQQAVTRYGKELLFTIMDIIKPYLPTIIANRSLIPIAIMIASAIGPIAIGSTFIVLELLGNITLFGIGFTLGVAKTTAKTSLSIAASSFYWLLQPFKKKETGAWKDKELKEGTVWPKGEQIMIVLKEKGGLGVCMCGSLPSDQKVAALVPLLRHKIKQQHESIQFMMGGKMVRLQDRVSSLTKGVSGVVQMQFVVLQAFG